tara:strand:- start:270 stop:719 length:450 start_codon:yes stop_codon:yes gene_type:complete
MTEEQFRELVREIVRETLDEMSTTGNVAGYLTPFAFRGDKRKNKELIKKIAQKAGWKLVKDVKSVNEAASRYHSFKNNQEKTSRQKIGLSIREAKKAIREIDHQLKILTKYKNEFQYSTDHYWKRTLRDIYNIEERLVKISQKLRELKT